jgi:hypothetical protein
MKTTINAFGKSLSGMTSKAALADMGMKQLSPAETNQALNDAGQVIINSTKVGYVSERSPGGEAWAKNPEWYKIMKGGAATLTGPTKKKISGGRFSGYSFKDINQARLKNTLIKTTTSTSVTVRYKKQGAIQERAEINQYGGESKMILLSPSGNEVTLDINVQARPHLGVAALWARLGDKTDPAHIEEIFGDMIVTIL